MPRAILLVAITLILAAVSCSDNGNGNGASPTATSEAGAPTATTAATAVEPTEAPFEGAQDRVEGTLGSLATAPPIATLADVRTGAHEGYDRIVFEFEGPGTGYRVEYVTDPTDCGSGEPSFGDAIGGGAYLQITFTSANAHDDAGAPTFGTFELDMPGGDLARQTCDFEAVVSWVVLLSRSDPRDFRVTALEDPTRLAVDIAQP